MRPLTLICAFPNSNPPHPKHRSSATAQRAKDGLVIKLDNDVIHHLAPHRSVPVHEATHPYSAFDDQMIIHVRSAGALLPITSTTGLSRQLRRALIAASDRPVPEIIAGHTADGSPSQTDHLAVVPLPTWTDPATDGALGGIALVVPRHASNAARDAVTRALVRLEQHHRTSRDRGPRTVTLLLGESGELDLRPWTALHAACEALHPRTWTQPSSQWVSATPVALDRNPGDLLATRPAVRAAAVEAARSSIAGAIRRIGLPAPAAIDVVRSHAFLGRTAPRAYPRFPIDLRKPARVLVHVRVRFAQRVRGPILLGAGRYQGLGLCMPVDGTWMASP